MRICIIGQRYNKFYCNKVMGGLEKVELDQIRLLSMFGEDIHLILSSDSEECDFEHVTNYMLSIPSKFSEEGQALGKAYNKKRNEEILSLVAEISPDVILTHDDNNPSLNNFISNNLSYPTVVFNHSPISRTGGIAVFSLITSLNHLSNEGHTTVFVSEAVRKEFQDFIQKSSKWLPNLPRDIDKTINATHHCPVVWNKIEKVEESGEDFFMLARPIKEKKLIQGIDYADGKIQIYTTKPKSEPDAEYLEKVKDRTENVHVGLPHEEIMKQLRKAKAVLITSDESASLVAFEANSVGVPVIVIHKDEGHPAKEITSPASAFPNYFFVQSGKTSKAEIIEYLKNFQVLSLEDKKNISEKTASYYSPEKSYRRLSGLLLEAIEKHRRKKQGVNFPLFDD